MIAWQAINNHSEAPIARLIASITARLSKETTIKLRLEALIDRNDQYLKVMQCPLGSIDHSLIRLYKESSINNRSEASIYRKDRSVSNLYKETTNSSRLVA
jgi:hypothetical protein